MGYRAKDLPGWVRFRARPVPKPVYTVPTRIEHMIALTTKTRAALLAAAIGQSGWLDSPAPGPLRVMLPVNLYAGERE
jgi:hypothetical protein